jgi:hypothetical protein
VLECELKREAGAKGSDVQRSSNSNIINKEKAPRGLAQDGGPLGMSFETSFISTINAKLPQVAGLVVGCLPDVSRTSEDSPLHSALTSWTYLDVLETVRLI